MTAHRTPIRTILLVVIAMALAACGGDDGAEVRDLGADGSASGSASGSPSGSASGSASGSPSGSGSGSPSGSASGSVSGSASGSASASASGSASGSGSATGSGTSESIEGDGGYEYASDVSSHRLVVLDICEINQLLDEDPVDFDSIAGIYRDGANSVTGDGSVRSVGGFAAAEDRLHGLDEYYETSTPLDDFVTAALDGTGMFEGTSEGVRRQGVQKGIQNQVMIAWVDHELAAALDKAASGELDPAEGAPHNWDEAWAFYHGAEPECAPYATADKRAGDFGTVSSNEAILSAMIAGRDALLDGDVAAAEEAAEAIRRAVFVTYSQAAIRYATLTAEDMDAGDRETAEVHQAEGLAFWRVIEAAAAEAGADVDAVGAVFDLGNEPASAGGGAEVRAALAPAWDTLGITEADIGELE